MKAGQPRAERGALPTRSASFSDIVLVLALEARPVPGSMQVVTLLGPTVLGPYRLDQFGFDDAHVCLVVDLGLNE
jgi:hypothetical protein